MIVFYVGYSAMQNKDVINAAYHYQKLVDNNCNGTDLQIAYGWLTNYLLTTKNDAKNAKTICTKGLAFYPTDEYLISLAKDIERKIGNTAELFNLFETDVNSKNASYNDYLAYAAELYDYLYTDTKTINDANKEKRMIQMLDKAIAVNSKSFEANYIYGMYYTSVALAADTRSKTETNPIQKDKAIALAKQHSESSISYFEKACSYYETAATKSTKQNENYKSGLQQLVNLYSYLNLSDKKTIVQTKLNKLN